MSLFFGQTRRKRKLLLASTLVFLLQSIAPAFQGLMAQTLDGYLDTVCTMYGPKTVFVAFETDRPERERDSASNCHECLVCLLQAKLNGQPQSARLLLDVRYLSAFNNAVEPLYLAANPWIYPRFLSRAPPV